MEARSIRLIKLKKWVATFMNYSRLMHLIVNTDIEEMQSDRKEIKGLV